MGKHRRPTRTSRALSKVRRVLSVWTDRRRRVQLGRGWADDWPETITLGDAADEIEFDLFVGDDEELVLVKRIVAPGDHYAYTTAELDDNDAEDRTSRLQGGLWGSPHLVPPVVILPGEGLRDGHHRVAIAHEAGLTRI